MSTPVAIANAFSDATGISNVILPLTKSKIHYYLNLKEKEIKPKFVNKNLSLKTNYPISGSDNVMRGKSLEVQKQPLVVRRELMW